MRAVIGALLAAQSVWFVASPNVVQAQSPAVDVGPARFISVNPFLPLFGYFSGEYEQRIKDNVAFAIAGSTVKYDERYTNLDAKLRLYPNERALDGFSIASSLGLAWINRKQSAEFCDIVITPGGTANSCNARSKTFTTPSFAIELSYQWLLGRSKSTAITGGFGAKRYLGGSAEDFRGLSRVLPTGRLSIGYGF